MGYVCENENNSEFANTNLKEPRDREICRIESLDISKIFGSLPKNHDVRHRQGLTLTRRMIFGETGLSAVN